MTTDLIFIFVVLLSATAIWAVVILNVWYWRFLKSLTPEELAEYKREESEDMRNW